MSSLNKLLEEQLETVPKFLLRRLVKKKLEDQGIKNAKLVEALTEHILSESDDIFHWDDESDQHKHLCLEFTHEDREKIEADIREFIDKKLPDVIRNSVRDSAKSFVNALNKRWPEQKVEERHAMQYFRDRNDLRWAKTLDPLRMLLIASREVGQDFAEKLNKSKAKNGIVKSEALLILHLRACQTTMEILVLLENGLADGAFARWRTLYEITVVASVINRFGDDIAERYLAHDVVSRRESMINEYQHEGHEYIPDELYGEEKEIEEKFQDLKELYGKSFVGPYGWAAESLQSKAPRFQDLERAIDWGAQPPNYKWSSYKVHAGVAGTVRSLGTFGDQSVLLSGASNAGIETPAINTSVSLLQVTLLVFGNLRKLESQIKLQALVLLHKRVLKEGRKAARKLVKDEMKIRSDS